jgi:succinate dehydrogenase / fumarate reductase, cytochrome b subunit
MNEPAKQKTLNNGAVRPRPMSPHLQIYRLPLEALTSICHRASGIALTGGAFVLVAWLYAAANSADCFNWWQAALMSPIGLFCMAGWSLALFYHLCAGTRHLIWDAGIFPDKKSIGATNIIVIASALILTAIAWLLALPKLPISFAP